MAEGKDLLVAERVSPSPGLPVGVVIVAAGEGRRMGGLDKIGATLLGRPLLAWTVAPFQRSSLVDRIVLVLREEMLAWGRELVEQEGWTKVGAVCAGGLRRQDSVCAGLQELRDCEWVIVHDGARPCVEEVLIQRGLAEAQETGAAVAAIPVLDTVKRADEVGTILATLPRDGLWMAQTPQVFRYDIIAHAHRGRPEEATDDAALVERLGYQVRVFPGTLANFKVTLPEDLRLAELVLRGQMDARGDGV